MATSIELIEATASVLGVNSSTCANVFRELRGAGLVSNEGRGRHAAQMTSKDAATFLIAVCTAERIQDSVDAFNRFGNLLATSGSKLGLVVPSPIFPLLDDSRLTLPPNHSFFQAIVFLIESFVRQGASESVQVSMRAPYPWAAICIGAPSETIEIWYHDNGDEHGPGELAQIDETKARQRRRFVSLDGDMSTTTTITSNTFHAIGLLLR